MIIIDYYPPFAQIVSDCQSLLRDPRIVFVFSCFASSSWPITNL